MAIINAVNLKNEKLKHRPEIDITKVFQIVNSPNGNRNIYLRFVVEAKQPSKSFANDVYWVFDTLQERNHNFILASKALQEEFHVREKQEIRGV